MKIGKKIIWVLAITSGTIGLVIIIWFSIALSQNYDVTGKILPQETGITGDFIGGVVGTLWSLTSVFLFYLALTYQRDDLKNQRVAIDNQVKEVNLQTKSIDAQTEQLSLQRKAIEQQTEQLQLQKEELELQREELKETRKVFIEQNDMIKIQRFENTFFQMVGLHHDITNRIERKNLDGLRKVLLKKLKSPENNVDILDEAKKSNFNKSTAWEYFKISYQNFYFNENHEVILSNYFRNLYHIYKFIFQAEEIPEPRKKFYSSIVRAQLSQSELFLIFYNSLCPNLGNPKFLFLVKHFDLMENFNKKDAFQFKFHEDIFLDLIENVKDNLNEKKPKLILPKLL